MSRWMRMVLDRGEWTGALLRRGRTVRRVVGSQLATTAASTIQWSRLWWRELSVFCLPFLALLVAQCIPPMKATLLPGASISSIATVQGAVTGLSLIALVFAVEVALRQEDRDDTVYEIMLKATGVRLAFVLAISALLATVLAMALSEFNLAQGKAVNRTICAYGLTFAVSGVLLRAVLHTVHALRPTSVIGYRVEANEDERRRRIEQFIATRRDTDPTETPQ